MGTRTSRSVLLPLATGMFTLGLLAVLIIFGLFAAGYQDLPLWLNAAALLAPAGLAVGVIGAAVQTRRS